MKLCAQCGKEIANPRSAVYVSRDLHHTTGVAAVQVSFWRWRMEVECWEEADVLCSCRCVSQYAYEYFLPPCMANPQTYETQEMGAEYQVAEKP